MTHPDLHWQLPPSNPKLLAFLSQPYANTVIPQNAGFHFQCLPARGGGVRIKIPELSQTPLLLYPGPCVCKKTQGSTFAWAAWMVGSRLLLVSGETMTVAIPMAHEAKPGKRQYGDRYVVCFDSANNLIFVPVDLIRGVDTAIDARKMPRTCWELHLYLAQAKHYNEVGSASSLCDVVTWSHTVKLHLLVCARGVYNLFLCFCCLAIAPVYRQGVEICTRPHYHVSV